MNTTEDTLLIHSIYLEREVTCTVLIPENTTPGNLLLLNDGQDTQDLNLKAALQYQYDRNGIAPVLVAAIHAGENRIQEYGIADKPDFKNRGAKADLYEQFIKEELLPALQQHTGFVHLHTIAFAGFSLGGLSALDITWHNPDIFNKVGVFSGALWWRSKDLSNGYTDNDRLMHQVVRETETKPELKFWLQAGTHDETADRNHNGIIDAIDDTIDLIKELENKGYTRPTDIQYLEVVGGEHNTATWARAMPKFLCWAFGN